MQAEQPVKTALPMQAEQHNSDVNLTVYRLFVNPWVQTAFFEKVTSIDFSCRESNWAQQASSEKMTSIRFYQLEPVWVHTTSLQKKTSKADHQPWMDNS